MRVGVMAMGLKCILTTNTEYMEAGHWQKLIKNSHLEFGVECRREICFDTKRSQINRRDHKITRLI